MKKLRILLNCNYLYVFLFLILVLYFIIYINIPRNTDIDVDNDKKIVGKVIDYKIDKDLLTIIIKNNEKVIGYYYFKSMSEIESFNIKLGDTVLLEGDFSFPTNNTVFNQFNYKKYLKYKYIYVSINVSNITKLKDNTNIFYSIKNSIINHISSYKSKAYLETFILGNKNMIDSSTYEIYQENGISHLLSISGMHITLLSTIILFILKKINISDDISLVSVSLFLIFYMFLTGLSASVIRSSIFFIFLTINKLLKLDISILKVYILMLIFIIFINPFIVYDIGFIYSFTISFILILFRDRLNNIFSVSLLSFLVSLPITLYNSYEINFFSIILNLFFVPFVSFIVFPLGLLTFFIPCLDNAFSFIIFIFENLSFLASKIDIFKFVFGRVDIFFIVIYYFLLFFSLVKNKKIFFLIIIFLLLKYNLDFNNYVITINVGQGDSSLIHYDNKNILIDTGGKVSLKKEKWQRQSKSLVDKTLVPLFKSFGIRKVDYLILTHGDYDHMGEAINLVNNFKVEKVIFNCGEYNDLEKELIKVLDKKKIKYYSCIKELNIDKNKLHFLQTKEYDNENDNSNVIYTELNDYKFMFMGDASVTTEKEIMSKYNLPDIDVLKVGHHGSKTSSGKDFIDEINPRYSVISVGKNNRYGHPNKEVLNNLENSKIYRTDQDGSIMFKIKNKKLKIDTCSP